MAFPVRVQCSFPSNVYDVTVQFDCTNLSYDSVSFAGCWGSGGNKTVTPSSGGVRVQSTGVLPGTTTGSSLFKIWFDVADSLSPYTAHSFAVAVTEWSIGLSNTDCSPPVVSGASDTTDHQGCVYIPVYAATFTAVSATVAPDADVSFNINLWTHFPVETDVDNGSGESNLKYSLDTTRVTSNDCYVLKTSQPSSVSCGFEGTLYYSTDVHRSGRPSSTGPTRGIIRFESTSSVSALTPVCSPAQMIDYIMVHTKNTSYCTKTINLNAFDSTTSDQWKIDCLLKPVHMKDSLFAVAAGGHSPAITLTDGTLTVQEQEGCPYLFAWDGSRFAEENTIVGHVDNGALAKPTPDFYRLQTRIPLDNNGYRLQIREFEQEQSSFDNFSLTAIDHPEGTLVNVSKYGEVSVLRDILLPVAAVDDQGTDCLAAVIEEDGVFYSRTSPGSITLTFLVGKGFGTESLALTGAPPPPPGNKKLAANGGSGPGVMVTEVLTKDGNWVRLDALADRANDGTENPVISPADLVIDGEITIRRSWETQAYVDQLTLRQPCNDESPLTELQLVSAVHSQNGNVTDKALIADNDLVTLVPGETVELRFADPTNKPVRAGYVRDFIFNTNGFYTSYKGDAAVPETYRLAQNFPNPFNPTTTIFYNLPVTTNVELSVFNMIGQKVRTLVNSLQQAGEQSVMWDGTDDNGSSVASGVYLYKLTTPDYTASRKMILMK